MIGNKNAIIFIFAGLVSFMMENKVKSGCKKTFKTNLISFLHNFGSIYLFFGSYLFGYHLFHLLTLIVVVFLWKVYSMCIVTIYYNNLCGITSRRPFHDIFYLINTQLKIPHFQYLMVLVVGLYDIKNILYK